MNTPKGHVKTAVAAAKKPKSPAGPFLDRYFAARFFAKRYFPG